MTDIATHKIERREHRRRRLRRHGRRAYIRSVYVLPSLATLGNAVCGFGAMYVATFDSFNVGNDPFAKWFFAHKFFAAAYLIFLAMVFDALDGRLARFARHTTDFGGQLDSLADVVSFGAAPAFLALQVFKTETFEWDLSLSVSRLTWAFAAIYFSCAAIRLARFNVSNQHGEQHHFSFLGLPSPGAAAAVAGFVLMQQDLREIADGTKYSFVATLAKITVCILPVVVLASGLAMVSGVRYPHLVNRYLRGKKSFGRLMLVLILLMAMIFQHRYVLALGALAYAVYGPVSHLMARYKSRLNPT